MNLKKKFQELKEKREEKRCFSKFKSKLVVINFPKCGDKDVEEAAKEMGVKI